MIAKSIINSNGSVFNIAPSPLRFNRTDLSCVAVYRSHDQQIELIFN